MVAATDLFGEREPQHGDIALCKSCGKFSMFDFTRRRNTLRRATPEERDDIGRNAGAQRLLHHKGNGQ
jgi:hypothetical protein